MLSVGASSMAVALWARGGLTTLSTSTPFMMQLARLPLHAVAMPVPYELMLALGVLYSMRWVACNTPRPGLHMLART